MSFTSLPHRLATELRELGPLVDFLQRSRWAQRAGEPGISDFVLGNPHDPVLPGFTRALERVLPPQASNWHAYQMSDPHACEVVARSLSEQTGVSFDPAFVTMTNGAFTGLSVALQTLVEPGDEVIYISPPWFFYPSMIRRAGGVPVSVSIDWERIDIDLEAIEAAITSRTRAIIVNSPHNPTGKVFSAEALQQLAEILTRASNRNGRSIAIISDEAYRRILFDGRACPTPAAFYPQTLVVYTFGKTLLTPGERIGFVALAPEYPQREKAMAGLFAAQVLTGYGFPNALLQHAIDDLDGEIIDLASLQAKRDRMVEGLRAAGYRTSEPEGTFYLVVESPFANEWEFVDLLAQDDVFVLPGTVFDAPGYIRISLTGTMEMIERALPIFAAAHAELLTPV
ncbi:MAG: aminotransferase class I/II-fold pyridoxal phosphate-dependent enzyme [Thermomicrobiales bacterium]